MRQLGAKMARGLLRVVIVLAWFALTVVALGVTHEMVIGSVNGAMIGVAIVAVVWFSVGGVAIWLLLMLSARTLRQQRRDRIARQARQLV